MAIKPTGWFDKFLVIDAETTGLNFDVTSNDITEGHQAVSWGLIVADFATMKPIEELYVEIKWDGVSEWHHRAEKIHGLSKEYLEKNGMDEEKAAELIGQLLYEHFGLDESIICMGHNVARFDIPFLKKLLYKYELYFKFSHRCLDSSSLGAMTLGTFTSQQLFDELGIKRGDVHNALVDAKSTLKACRMIRSAFQSCL